jgi:hypothetical protein
VIQFKLVNRETQKKFNTLTFLNAPMGRLSDPNVSTLQEVLVKLQNSVIT